MKQYTQQPQYSSMSAPIIKGKFIMHVPFIGGMYMIDMLNPKSPIQDVFIGNTIISLTQELIMFYLDGYDDNVVYDLLESLLQDLENDEDKQLINLLNRDLNIASHLLSLCTQYCNEFELPIAVREYVSSIGLVSNVHVQPVSQTAIAVTIT